MTARMTARMVAAMAALLFAAGCTTTTTETRAIVGSTGAPEARPASGSGDGDASRRAAARMELAAAYYARGQLDVALQQLKLALQADPNLASAHNLSGLILANQGDDAGAEASFRRALQINPRDGDAMNNFGWFLCQRKRYPESFAQFDAALGMPAYRDPARTLLAKGVCLAFDKQYAEAERNLARSLQLDPGNPSTATNLAEVQYRLGQYERARDTIRRVNNQPGVSSAQTLWLAARIERRLNNTQALGDLGVRLRSQFPGSPETEAFDRGRWGD